MLRATHFRIDRAQRDRNGRLHVTGRLTRTGVFPYYVGGEKRMEFRPEASVFDPHALQTLKAAPVTIDHPRAFVTPKDAEVVGRVTSVHVEPPFIIGEMVLEDDEAIQLVEAGKLTEISLGYETDLERGDSEDYDLIQTNIRYNHAALGGPGWSRMGDTTLHLDGTTHYIMDTAMTEQHTDEAAAEPVAAPEELVAEEVEPKEVEISEAPAVEAVAEEAPEATEAPEVTEAVEEAPEEEEKPAVDFAAMDSKLDTILSLLQSKEDSADVPRLDSDEFKAAVEEAVKKALEEKTVPVSDSFRERILGELPENKPEKFSKLRKHVLGE